MNEAKRDDVATAAVVLGEGIGDPTAGRMLAARRGPDMVDVAGAGGCACAESDHTEGGRRRSAILRRKARTAVRAEPLVVE